MSSMPEFLNLRSPQRKVSDSRIKRINKMFDAKIKDEVSVVSNNSTSVLQDICGPLNISEEDDTVKYKSSSNVTTPESVSSSETFDDEVNPQFMPKLRSKQSIVNLSQHNTPKKLNTFPKRRQLKEKLGDPLPLPYLDPQQKMEVGRDLQSRWNTIISNAKVRQTNAEPVNKAKRVLEAPSFESQRKISRRVFQSSEITALESQLKDTSAKLDRLIDILQDKETLIGKSMTYEPVIWLSCIIILVLCNVWVYHYL
ncbi:Kar1 [Kluyveromyces lactis]|nr:Kar1 [Kluyveromyces lactis]